MNDKNYSKEYYAKNKETVKARLKRNRSEKIAWFNGIKQDSICEKCGEDRWYLINFHHITEDKFMDVARMVQDSYSKERILEEMEKCECLCYNCHMEFHHIDKHIPEEGLCVSCGITTFVKDVRQLPIVAMGASWCTNWRVCANCWADIQIHGKAYKEGGTHEIVLGKPRFDHVLYSF